mmetsp:Transcript_73910/g.175915  ORF Transcript_73910/g.175915 Transcript_73910/m.175915 type:complete len:226 (+) Transcript_73910:399-1076(+)
MTRPRRQHTHTLSRRESHLRWHHRMTCIGQHRLVMLPKPCRAYCMCYRMIELTSMHFLCLSKRPLQRLPGANLILKCSGSFATEDLHSTTWVASPWMNRGQSGSNSESSRLSLHHPEPSQQRRPLHLRVRHCLQVKQNSFHRRSRPQRARHFKFQGRIRQIIREPPPRAAQGWKLDTGSSHRLDLAAQALGSTHRLYRSCQGERSPLSTPASRVASISSIEMEME